MIEKILYTGIDVSKSTLDIALTLDSKKILATKKVANNLSGYKVLEDWVKEYANKHKCIKLHFCMEATGIYSQGLAEYFFDRENFIVSIINPAQIKGFSQSILLRTKTDKSDAKMIAIYAATIKPEASVQIPEELRILKELYRFLNYLKDNRVNEITRLESAKNPVIEKSIRKIISSYDEQIREIEKLIKEHVDKNSGLKENVNLLKTIPGIADTSAWLLLSEMHIENDSGKFSAKRQTAHAGLAPGQKQSGSSINGRSHICKTGNHRIRDGLYMPTLSAIQWNQPIKEFNERLISNGKCKMVALIASMRKLLVIAIGILNNRSPFDPDWTKKKQDVPASAC